MIKDYFWIILFLVLGVTIIFMAENKGIKTACINNNCFEVEIAKSQEEKKKGLSLREDLPFNSGMLFVYNKENFYSFWMKDMNFPLDIIWINADNKIVHIEKKG